MIKDDIIEIIKKNRPDINNIETVNFVTDNIIDSFDIINLVSDFNKKFSIYISGADIIPENFDKLDNIVNMIKKYLE